MIDSYEAVFLPTVVVTMTEDASVATITFDWADSFQSVVETRTQREMATNDVSAPFVTVMDRWTKQFPKTWRTEGLTPSAAVKDWMWRDKTIQAIKELRAETGMGLALAKDLVVDRWIPKYKKGYRA